MILFVIVVGIFLLLETSNVLVLYFRPGSTKANSVGVFSAWEKSKQDPEIHSFVKYLVWWIAGTKLFLLSVLFVILMIGDEMTQTFTLLAMIFSTATFFWKLYPLVKAMDAEDQLEVKGYSRTLGGMILVMILAFLIVYLVAAGFIGNIVI